MVKNECGQSGDGTLKLNVSEEWTDGGTDFLHVGTDSQKQIHQNFFFLGIVKKGCAQSSHGTLKLPVHFLHAGANLGKLKVDLMI